MTSLSALERYFTDTLQLTRRPVAVALCDTPPPGVPRLSGSQPSGCSFWRLAADGQVFFTEPRDHYNCPIGSYTHNIPLPEPRAHELGDTLNLMSEIGYIRMTEVPDIPRLPRTPAATVYSPLSVAPVQPDIVVLCGKPGKLMRLHEAATHAARPSQLLLGRPTCMALPASLSGGIASSLGCVGNRVYTGISDDELYVMVAGKDLEAIADALQTITTANATLSAYHLERRDRLTTA